MKCLAGEESALTSVAKSYGFCQITKMVWEN
jgi:hypothetical protein